MRKHSKKIVLGFETPEISSSLLPSEDTPFLKLKSRKSKRKLEQDRLYQNALNRMKLEKQNVQRHKMQSQTAKRGTTTKITLRTQLQSRGIQSYNFRTAAPKTHQLVNQTSQGFYKPIPERGSEFRDVSYNVEKKPFPVKKRWIKM